MPISNINKNSIGAAIWGELPPAEATHYDPDFIWGPPWRRKEEDGRWFGKHPDGGWYHFDPTPEEVEKYIARPY